MKPSVGRIVHFYQKTSGVLEHDGPLAAIVTWAYDDDDQPVNLTVFTNGAARFEGMVSAKEFNDRRYWEWPPRDAAPAPAVIDPKALPVPAMPEAVILSGYVPAFEVESFDPCRRNNTALMAEIEIDIMDATTAVENIGAHPWLTDAVVLLVKARNKVADYIDLVPRQPARPPAPSPDGIPPFQREHDAASEQRVDDTGEDIDPGLRA
jgi:hypothetical protein